MKKTTKRLLVVILLLVLIFAGGTFYLLQRSTIQEDSEFTFNECKPQQAFEIISYSNPFSTLESLAQPYIFKVKRFHKVKAGHYTFKEGTSLNAVINTLRSGKQSPIKLTFNNTRTMADFAGKIAKQIEADSLTLLNFLQNDSVAKSYGFDKANFIGMFLPNTYEFYYTTTPKVFADRMHKEYNRFWSKSRQQKAKQLGYTPQEVSTLAAIVDEETNKNDEKARIAGVYLNRLKRGIPLQADPTLKYAAGDFTLKRILNIHKETDSPYNTYKYAGLPPSPIRQPSITAIDAVLNAEKHDYLYFCAKADFSGYHTFAKTLAQHNRNARLYHKELNRRGIR